METQHHPLTADIQSQFDLWERLVADSDALSRGMGESFRDREYDDVVVFGSGSCYNLARSIAAVMRTTTGRRATACSASELMLYGDYWLNRANKYLAVALSRDGEEPEILGALAALRKKHRVSAVAVTCARSSPLARSAELCLSVDDCRESGTVMLQSFTALFVLSCLFVLHLDGKLHHLFSLERLVAEGRDIFEAQKGFAEALGESMGSGPVIFLGGGPMYGLACEGRLLFERLGGVPAQAWTPFEFGFGAVPSRESGAVAVLFATAMAREFELRLLADLKNIGVRTVALSDARDADLTLAAAHTLSVGRGLPEAMRGILHMPLVQTMALRAGRGGAAQAGLRRGEPFAAS